MVVAKSDLREARIGVDEVNREPIQFGQPAVNRGPFIVFERLGREPLPALARKQIPLVRQDQIGMQPAFQLEGGHRSDLKPATPGSPYSYWCCLRVVSDN